MNTIIEERTVRDLIPKLKGAGAQGIVEYPLNKIVAVGRGLFGLRRSARGPGLQPRQSLLLKIVESTNRRAVASAAGAGAGA